jgi:DNA-binding CsgD family transcriptional regulator
MLEWLSMRNIGPNHGLPDMRIEEVLRFALGALRASSSVFYWIDETLEMQSAQVSGACEESFHLYEGGMNSCDPLNVRRLVTSGKRVATLDADHGLAPAAEYARYCSYLRDSRISDVLDFVFWHGDFAFAGLGIIKTTEDPPFCAEALSFAASMQPYIEFNLFSHPRLRHQRLTRQLSAAYGLTRREIEVTKLVRQGCTNHDVADELGIALTTVKTHLMRLFDKLGVENRTSLVSRINQMEGEHLAAA